MSGRKSVGLAYAVFTANADAIGSEASGTLRATPSLPYHGTDCSAETPVALRKRSTTSSKAARYTAVLPAPPVATSAATALPTSAKTGAPVVYSTPLVTL